MSTDADLSRSEQNKVQRYIDARARAEELDAELKKAKAFVERCESEVLDLYVENGWQNVKCNGRVVSLVKKTYARPVPEQGEALLAALREHGYGDLVKSAVLPSTLSALVREHARDDDPLPESIAQHIIVTELFSVSMKKS
jgi:predicted ATP-dependent Lon-type protease